MKSKKTLKASPKSLNLYNTTLTHGTSMLNLYETNNLHNTHKTKVIQKVIKTLKAQTRNSFDQHNNTYKYALF